MVEASCSKRHRFPHNPTAVQKMVSECVQRTGVNLYFRKTTEPTILFAFTAHHTPNITLCYSVTLRDFVSTKTKPNFITMQDKHGIYFSSLWRYHFTKLISYSVCLAYVSLKIQSSNGILPVTDKAWLNKHSPIRVCVGRLLIALSSIQ